MGKEPDSSGGTVRIDPESTSMDDDVMVEPTQQRQVGRVVIATVDSVANVMRLESVGVGAAVDGTDAVALMDGATEPFRKGSGPVPDAEQPAIGGEGIHLDDGVAEDRLQCGRPQSES